jgi:flagellar L-ring protein precursor FlgH
MLLSAFLLPDRLCADNLWDRRDPYNSHLFYDYRARRVGDILTISIDETTGSDAQEIRAMEKNTNADMSFGGKGSSTALGKVLRSFAFDLDLNSSSARKFDGKNNSTIDRKFTDRMSVMVVAVLPNGNIVFEGCRQRLITRELRTLRITGIVRPADINGDNVVQSQFIANLFVSYEGRGPESAYTNQGWGGRIVNKLWPF